MGLGSLSGNISNASKALNIGNKSSQSGVFTNMVNALNMGSSIVQGVGQIVELTASVAVIAVGIANRFNSKLEFNMSYEESPYKRFKGGITYKDFKGTKGDSLSSTVCTASSLIQHLNDDGTLGQEYTVIRYSGRKTSVVDPDNVVEEPPVKDFIDLYWNLLSYFKDPFEFLDIIPWDMASLVKGLLNTTFEIPRLNDFSLSSFQYDTPFSNEPSFTNKPEWKVDNISNPLTDSKFNPIGSSGARLHIYRKDNPDAESGKAAEFYCISTPNNLSYSSTASYDEENVRGSQTPYRFYNHQEGKTISFSVDLHQQEYNVPLQKLVDIATSFTNPYSNGDYALKPKVVVVELPGFSFEGYCTEVRVDYSSEKGWYYGGEIENAGFGSVTLDFSFAVLENVILQKTGSKSGFGMMDAMQVTTYRSSFYDPDFYMMAPAIDFSEPEFEMEE